MATVLRENVKGTKLFNDSVHGSIELDARLVKHIIDTPEFQRLRRIKQLGGVYYVFPEAQHNRFEHSIGTAYLAGKLARHLQKLHGTEIVSDRDVRCLEIAALCHDLGHGPFSHLFDRKFMRSVGSKNWKHEEGSCILISRILTEDVLEKLDLTTVDLDLIKELILPRNKTISSLYADRTRGKSFLFEIISNKETGVDVDKWDYFARDCHHLGIPNGFDHIRFIRCTRLIPDDNGERHVCVRDKEVFNLYEMFHTRFTLHRRAYQHKSANAVEHMVCDAMVAANDAVRIYDGECGCKISECVENTEAFLNLDDSVLKIISNWNESNNSNLNEAKRLLSRLERGNRYKCVGNKILGFNRGSVNENEVKQGLEKSCSELKDNLIVSIISINYGSKGDNPIHKFRFFRKENLEKFVKIPKEEVSLFLPDVFEEKLVQVFCKSEEKSLVKRAEREFSKWYVDFKPRAIDKILCVCKNLKQTEEDNDIAEKISDLLLSFANKET